MSSIKINNRKVECVSHQCVSYREFHIKYDETASSAGHKEIKGFQPEGLNSAKLGSRTETKKTERIVLSNKDCSEPEKFGRTEIETNLPYQHATKKDQDQCE